MIKNNERIINGYYHRPIDIIIPRASNRRLVIPKRQVEVVSPQRPTRCYQTVKRQPIPNKVIGIRQDEEFEEPYSKNIVAEQFSDNNKHRSRIMPVMRLCFLLLGCLCVMVMSGSVVVVVLKSNVKAENSISSQTITPNKKSDSDVNKAKTGRNSAVNSHKYADDEPRSIEIKSIGVNNAMLPVGLDKSNTLMAPDDVHTAGWYDASSNPGQAGAMLIDGHGSESGTYYGLFSRLNELKSNDQIIITRGDGKRIYYKTAKVEIKPIDKVDMAATLDPYGDAEQGLNIISCTGRWIKNHTTLDHRVIVFAVR